MIVTDKDKKERKIKTFRKKEKDQNRVNVIGLTLYIILQAATTFIHYADLFVEYSVVNRMIT